MIRLRTWRYASLLAVIALVMVACGDGDAVSTTTTVPAETMTTTVIEPTTVSFAELKIAAKVPMYIADRDGIFAANGIVWDASFGGGGAEIIPAILSGDLDGGHANIASLIFAHVAGADLVCVSSSDSAKQSEPDTGNYYVTPESDIESIEDLIGKTVAVNNLNSLLWVYAYGLFTQAGFDPEDVEFVEVPFGSMGDALSQGQVDAIMQIEPFGTIYQAAGIARVLSPVYIPVISGADLGCQVFSRQWIEDNPEAARGFADSYDEAKEFAQADEAAARLAVVEWTEMDPDLAGGIVLSDWHPGVDVASFQEFADLMFDFGLTDARVDVTEFVWEDAVVFER